MRLVQRANEVLIQGSAFAFEHAPRLKPDCVTLIGTQQVRHESEQRDHACSMAQTLARRVGRLESEKGFLQVRVSSNVSCRSMQEKGAYARGSVRNNKRKQERETERGGGGNCICNCTRGVG